MPNYLIEFETCPKDEGPPGRVLLRDFKLEKGGLHKRRYIFNPIDDVTSQVIVSRGSIRSIRKLA